MGPSSGPRSVPLAVFKFNCWRNWYLQQSPGFMKRTQVMRQVNKEERQEGKDPEDTVVLREHPVSGKDNGDGETRVLLWGEEGTDVWGAEKEVSVGENVVQRLDCQLR